MKKNNILNEKIVNGRKVWEIGSFVIYPSKEYEKKCAKLNAELRRYKKLYSSMCSAERRKIIDHKWYQKRKMEEKDEI